MSVPWAARARSDAYWEQQVCEEARGRDNAEARKESATVTKRPTLVDHSQGLRNCAAPPADLGE